MEVLNSSDYWKAESPLGAIPINTLFAKAVVNRQVSGVIYVNDNISPRTFYVAHPYGMSLLYGETHQLSFNEGLFRYLIDSEKKRVKSEWLQVFPAVWNQRLKDILGRNLIRGEALTENQEGKVIEYTRVNFKFNPEKYYRCKEKLNLPDSYRIITDKAYIYGNMDGQVVPRFFWDTPEKFALQAVAFSLIHNQQIASTAFSSFLLENNLEIGIETLYDYRGKGLASFACSLLIDYCLKHGMTPVWACRLENQGSYLLAQSLGFEPCLSVPYYKLAMACSG